jgi:CubicO group peptidase (beta-lactamase class C family)
MLIENRPAVSSRNNLFQHKNMIVKIIFALLIACPLLGAGGASAQTRSAPPSRKGVVQGEVGAKADELLTRYAMYGFSGTVIIVKNDQIVIHKAYGLADRESGRPNTVDSLYDVGSIAKTFTAAAILQLEMRGKLKTSDLVSAYLGEFPADKAGITIHHLLTHTAGLKLDAGDVGINPATAPDEFLRKVKDAPLLSAPGDKYNYSNLGYGLLAVIIEKVSGQNWHTYLRKNILKRAGLSRTMLYGDAFPPDRLAQGYSGNSEEDLKREEPLRLERPDSYIWRKYTIGSGGVVTSTGELYKWWQALHSKKILSAEARRKMFTIQAGTQGYGWNINGTQNEITRIYRGGLRGSYQSMLGYYPKENALLIFGLNKNVTDISSLWLGVAWNNLEKVISGKDYVVPPAVLPVSATNLGRYAGEYELPSGDRFVAWVENDRLFVGAIGQAAVNLLVYPQQPPPAFQRDVGVAGKQVVEWLSKNELSQIKNSGYLSEKDLPVLQARWGSWMKAVGVLKSFQILGVSPGSGGNPRTFVRLNGERSSLVVRLLWNWNQRRLIAWGDNIQLPAVLKLLPEAETRFVNFDFDRSQTLRVSFDTSSEGNVTGLTVRSADGRSDAFARKTGKPQTASESVVVVDSEAKNDISALPVPTPQSKTNGSTDSKFAEYLGPFETPRGVITFSQEGETLIGGAGGDRLELVPDKSAKDKFWARAGSERVTFERGAGGKVVGVTVLLGNGQEIKGKKIK